MELLDLPGDILVLVIEQIVETQSERSYLRKRLVSKFFDAEIIRAIYATGRIESFNNLHSGAIMSRVYHETSPQLNACAYGLWRLKRDPSGSCSLIDTIRRTADGLVAAGHSYDTVLLSLCSAAVQWCGVTTFRNYLADLNDGKRHYLEEETHLWLTRSNSIYINKSYQFQSIWSLLYPSPQDDFRFSNIGPFPEPINQDSMDGINILTAAAYIGDRAMVKQSIRLGCPVNAYCRFFGSPLRAAACGGHKDIVLHILREYGRSPDDAEGEWPLLREFQGPGQCPMSAAAQNGHLEIVQLLRLEQIMSVYQNKTTMGSHAMTLELAMYTAALLGHLAVVDYLIDQDLYDRRISQFHEQEDYPEWYPGINEHKDIEHPMDECGNISHSVKEMVLVCSVHGGHINIIESILDSGVSPEVSLGREHKSLLTIAAFHGYSDIVEMLIERGASLIPLSCCYGPRSLIFTAICGGWLSLARKLLEDYSADLATSLQRTLLTAASKQDALLTAASKQDATMVEFLLDRGVKIDRNINIIYAIEAMDDEPHIATLRLLAQHGVDPHKHAAKTDRELDYARSPLHKAVYLGYYDLVKFFEEHGVRPIRFENGSFYWKD